MLLHLLKATCYRVLGRLDMAECELFKIVTAREFVTYCALATLELGIVKFGQRHFGEARHWLMRYDIRFCVRYNLILNNLPF